MTNVVYLELFKIARLHKEADEATKAGDYTTALAKLRESLEHIKFIKARRGNND